MKEMINLIHNITKLKELKRTGWCLKEIPNPESVADHSFRVALLAMLLGKDADVDINKCIKIALVHDIEEIVTGDLTPHDNISKEQKAKFEKNALQKILNNSNNTDIENLTKEYKEKQTKEGIFVSELDKLEMVFQALEYEKKYPEKKEQLNEFWEYAKNKIKNQKLLNIIQKLEKERKN